MKVSEDRLNIRMLSGDDIESVMTLQDSVLAGLVDKEHLRRNTEEMMLQSISAPNIAIGVFDKQDDRLIALGIMVDAKGTDEDLSVGLEKFTTDNPINMKSIMVADGYRGNGFQKKLMKMLEEKAVEKGYTHSCTSIHPDNIYSMRNAVSLGYKYDHTARKYGGMVRDILVKTL